jgi:C_GCAxxG_C_C family probable redox protein
LAAVAANQKITSELIPNISTAFCSGLAETGGMCGALSGGILSLSMVYGRATMNDNREQLYQKTQCMIKNFQDTFKHLSCTDLLQLQLGQPGANEAYQARGLNMQCEEFVRTATRLTVDLIHEETGV